MRIGFDARLVYYQQAGIGQYIINLLAALTELEQERAAPERNQYVIFQRGRDELPLVTESFQQRVNLRTPAHHRFEQPALSLELARFAGLDVLHSPDFIPPLWLARLRRPASVVTMHDLAFLRLPHLSLLTGESKGYYGQVQAAARAARRVIAVSESTRRDIIELLGVDERKVAVVYEAANALYHPVGRQELRRHLTISLREKIGDQRGFILFVSTIEPRKNIPTLLQAYAILRDTVGEGLPNLVLAGRKGWLFDEVFEQVRKLGLREQVIFTGAVTAQELLYLYNQAVLLASPSFYEGFGLPVLEAMSCGLPVVAANSSSLPEVAGAAAILVAPSDVEGWAAAMRRLLEDETLRRDLREKGLQQARTFSWRRAAAETLVVYQAVAEELWQKNKTT